MSSYYYTVLFSHRFNLFFLNRTSKISEFCEIIIQYYHCTSTILDFSPDLKGLGLNVSLFFFYFDMVVKLADAE